jgi:hypothetical protein
MRRTLRHRPRALTAILVAAVISCEPPGPDAPDEDPRDLVVLVTGDCAAGGAGSAVLRRIDAVEDRGARVELSSGAAIDIPEGGAYGVVRGSLRQGGFQLYGDICLPNGRPCPPSRAGSRFRRCVAVRRDWFLELRCTDGLGLPTCTSQVRE